MATKLRVLLITLVTLLQFIATVFLELIAAMAVYFGLSQLSADSYGSLVSLSGDVLSLFSAYFKQFFPEAANHANATLLGELSPKAMLLLLVGLTIGALLRFIFWGIKCSVKRKVTLG
ncbi:MAG: hypothetical protein ACRBBN_14995 [Methyloligellaceae bacterium]